MWKKRNYKSGNIYHVYNRGNKKSRIFYDHQDYRYYLRKLQEYCKETDFKILCYCLMPNHVHLCLEQGSHIGLNKLILRLHTSYARYFNIKYKMVGHIFQGGFKFKNVETCYYLLYLSGYIHLNPTDLGYEDPASYPYSSAKEYTNPKEMVAVCDQHKILAEFNDIKLLYKYYLNEFKKDNLEKLSSEFGISDYF